MRMGAAIFVQEHLSPRRLSDTSPGHEEIQDLLSEGNPRLREEFFTSKLYDWVIKV